MGFVKRRDDDGLVLKDVVLFESKEIKGGEDRN